MGRIALCMVFLISQLPAGEEPVEKALRAFRAGRIVPVEGDPVEPGVLLVRGRLVERIQPAGEEIPAGVELVDLGDAVLIPGLVNPHSQVLLSPNYRDGQRGAISAGGGSPGDSRNVKAAERIDPESIALKRLGRSGYAALAVAPPGNNFLGGLAAVARPRIATDRKEILIRETAYLSMAYALGQPLREIAERELKKAAEAHKKAREEREKKVAKPEEKKAGEGEKAEKKDASKSGEQEKLENAEKAKKDEKGAGKTGEAKAPPDPKPPDPLVQVFEGKLPAFLRIESDAALEHLFLILETLPETFRFVLLTPPLEPEVVKKVASRKEWIQAVVLEPRLEWFADTSISFNTARLFAAAGMDVALVPLSDDLVGHSEVFFFLGELVKGGLSEEAALRAVTAVPAKLLGVQGQVGSLLPGREASFLVFDGDPLSGRARILRIYLQGEEVYRDDPATGKASGEAVR